MLEKKEDQAGESQEAPDVLRAEDEPQAGQDNPSNTIGQQALHGAIMPEQTSGPYPHPMHLQAYDNIQPGFAARIIRMAESQIKHRHAVENKLVSNDHWQRMWKNIFRFLIAFSFIVGGFWLLQNDNDSAGLASLAGAVIAYFGGSALDAKLGKKDEE
jgi:uncharacterized membrane protein